MTTPSPDLITYTCLSSLMCGPKGLLPIVLDFLSSELGDSGLSGGTKFHPEHQRITGLVPSLDEQKDVETLKESRATVEGSTYYVPGTGPHISHDPLI